MNHTVTNKNKTVQDTSGKWHAHVSSPDASQLTMCRAGTLELLFASRKLPKWLRNFRSGLALFRDRLCPSVAIGQA